MNATRQQAKFATGAEAFGLAKRKSRYGHRNWLVWTNGGEWFAAEKCLESIEQAIADSGDRKFYLVGANDGVTTNIGKPLARIMLSNARGGYEA